MSTSRARTLAVNLLVAALSTAVCLAALEGAARLERRGRKGGKEQRTRLLYVEHDPLLGWRKRPGGRAVYERREYTVEVAINRNGLRDEPRDYQAPSGAFRVLALGDSFVEAFMVPLEQTVTQRLEDELHAGQCPAEVINGGTSGYSTDQEYLFYREEGVRYSPQVVLLFFYYNDIVYNALPSNIHIPKPLLSFAGKTATVANYPVPPQPVPPQSAADPEAFQGSAALAWLEERTEGSAPRLHELIARLGLWAPVRRMRISPEFRVYMARTPPEVKEAWDATQRILRALADETKAHGARLLVVYIPSKMEVGDGDWEATRLRYGLKPEKWDRARVQVRLGRLCREENIALLDLTPALKRSTGLLSRPYYRFDSHWNAAGQRVAAREIAAFLRAQGWTAACGAAARTDRAERSR